MLKGKYRSAHAIDHIRIKLTAYPRFYNKYSTALGLIFYIVFTSRLVDIKKYDFSGDKNGSSEKFWG